MQIKSWRLQVSLALIGLIAVVSVATQFMKAQAKHDRATRMHSLFNSRLIPDRLAYYAELFDALTPGQSVRELKAYFPEMKTRIAKEQGAETSQDVIPDRVTSVYCHFDDVLKLFINIRVEESQSGKQAHLSPPRNTSVSIYGVPRFVEVIRDIAVQGLNVRYGDGKKHLLVVPSKIQSRITSVYWKGNQKEIFLSYIAERDEFPTDIVGPSEDDLSFLSTLHIAEVAYLGLSLSEIGETGYSPWPDRSPEFDEYFKRMSYPSQQGTWPWDPVEPTVDSVKTSP